MSREFLKRNTFKGLKQSGCFQQECWAPFLRLVVNRSFGIMGVIAVMLLSASGFRNLPDGLRGHTSGRAPLFSGVLCCG